MSTAFTNLHAVPIDGALPPQNTGTAGRALISNGTSIAWNTVLSMIGSGAGQSTPSAVAAAVLPSQNGNSGKYLTTDGAGTLSWATAASAASGVTSIRINNVPYTGDVTITNVPSATTATTAVNVTGTVAISNGGTGATSATAALTNIGGAPLASPAFTGTPTAPTMFEDSIALTGSQIAVNTGSVFTRQISGATTLSVTGVPPAGKVACFLLDLLNGGSAVITWWSGIVWSGGRPPQLTAVGRDLLLFVTYNGGVTWTGLVVGKDVK